LNFKDIYLYLKKFIIDVITPEGCKGDKPIIIEFDDDRIIIPSYISIELRYMIDLMIYGYVFIAMLSWFYNFGDNHFKDLAYLWITIIGVFFGYTFLFEFAIHKYKDRKLSKSLNITKLK